MRENFLKVKWIFNNGFFFKILYLLLGFLSFNSISANSTFLTVYSFVLTGIGGCYIIYRLFHFNSYKQTKGLLILALFLLSYALSSLLTIEYGVVPNIKALTWLAMNFFLLYANNSEQSIEDIKREARIFGWVIIAYTFVVSLLGVGCFVLNYHSYKMVNGIGTITGFLWNRLWGFYSDPNYGAVLAVISVMLSAFYLFVSKKAIVRILLLANVLVQLFYIAFSDSRTAQIAMVVAFGWAVIVFAKKMNCISKIKPVFKQVVVFGMVVLVAASSLLAIKGAQTLGNRYLSAVKDPDSVLFYWMDPDKREELLSNEQVAPPENDDSNALGRPIEDMGSMSQEGGGDISNRRFAIWGSAFEIFETSPITGISFRNIVPYTQENLPETYIVNNDQTDFASMHNMFVDVMVSQGALGIVLLVVFICLALFTIFKKIFRLNDDYGFCSALLCVIVPIFVSAFFYSEIFYINTAGSAIFWIALGYLISLIKKSKVEIEVNNEPED